MYTRVTKDQFEIREGVYIHTPTEAEFAPNPSSEGSMLIYTGNIGSKLASDELFAYAELNGGVNCGNRLGFLSSSIKIAHSHAAKAQRLRTYLVHAYASHLRSVPVWGGPFFERVNR